MNNRNNNRMLWSLIIILTLGNFGWTTYVLQYSNAIADKLDTRLRYVETEQAITKREQIARTEYFKELRELMVDLREQIDARRKR